MAASSLVTRFRQALTLSPSSVWLVVFVPALVYFISTRLQQAGFWLFSGSAALGDMVTSDVVTAADTALTNCPVLASVFYMAASCASAVTTPTVATTESVLGVTAVSLPLKHGLHAVQEKGLADIVASTWRHDDELGRGYLLLSQAAAAGRIWRWEVGGGPIAIGRTLALDESGCRSEHFTPCQQLVGSRTGSGGIAIDFHGNGHIQQGSLVVAEWGEGRIVRLEENGARTPLLLEVPNVCATTAVTPSNSTAQKASKESPGTNRRLEQPTSLLYTPFGDLLVIDSFKDCNQAALLRLRNAVHVQPLASLPVSRQAHGWMAPQHDFDTDVLFADNVQQLGGMALTNAWTSVYVTAKKQDGDIVLMRIPLGTEDDYDEEDGSGKATREPELVMNLSKKLPSIKEPGSIAVDHHGRVFWAVEESLLVVDPVQDRILGTLSLPTEPTSVTLGEDGFLYISTHDTLLRIRIREGPVKVPTNMVVRPTTVSSSS